MAIVLAAKEKGFLYKNSKALSAMSVLNQTRSTQITVAERLKVPPTDPMNILSVLPSHRSQSCESQVALFRNRWYSDHETRMAASAVSIKAGRVVYGRSDA
jgi:hypothetical protein